MNEQNKKSCIKKSWYLKHEPKTVKELIGNNYEITTIQNWLNNFDKSKKLYLEKKTNIKMNKNVKKIKKVKKDTDNINDVNDENKKDKNNNNDVGVKKNNSNNTSSDIKIKSLRSCLSLIGKHGIGKTTMVRVILKEMGFTIKELDLTFLGSKKEIDVNIDKTIFTTNIIDKVNDNNNIKTVLLIDNFESIKSTIEQNFIKVLIKKNSINWFIPIIIISDKKHSSFTNSIISNSLVIRLNDPCFNDMAMVLERVCKVENVKFTRQTAESLINYSNCDYRNMISLLEDIVNSYGNEIKNKQLSTYLSNSKMRDVDVDIYTAIQELLSNYEDVKKCLILYESEKAIIPMMMHENYIHTITELNKNNDNNLELAMDISETLSLSDKIENYIYNDQNWDMYEMNGLISCAYTSHKISSYIKNNKNRIQHIKMTFPNVYTRTSMKFMNIKHASNSCFRNMNINNIINIGQLLRQLINDKRYEECGKILRENKIDITNLISFLKLDKTDKTSNDELTSKITLNIKKKIAKYI